MKKIKNIWWLTLLVGVGFSIIGILALVMPDLILSIVFVLAGAVLIFSGFNDLFTYSRLKDNGREGFIFYAVLNIFLGMLLVANPTYSAVAVIYYFGVWMLLRGLIQIVLGRRFLMFGGLTQHLGIMLSVVGLILLLFPKLISGTFMFLFGLFAIVFGMSQISDAIRIKEALKPELITDKKKKFREK